MKNNPCWNCPRRRMHCAVGCPDWEKHRVEKQAEYERRAILAASKRATYPDTVFRRLQNERTARMAKGNNT